MVTVQRELQLSCTMDHFLCKTFVPTPMRTIQNIIILTNKNIHVYAISQICRQTAMFLQNPYFFLPHCGEIVGQSTRPVLKKQTDFFFFYLNQKKICPLSFLIFLIHYPKACVTCANGALISKRAFQNHYYRWQQGCHCWALLCMVQTMLKI